MLFSISLNSFPQEIKQVEGLFFLSEGFNIRYRSVEIKKHDMTQLNGRKQSIELLCDRYRVIAI